MMMDATANALRRLGTASAVEQSGLRIATDQNLPGRIIDGGCVPTIGEGGMSRYLAEIRKFPMLNPQEEYMLAKRWREHEDTEAAHKLVTSHLGLVAKIAMGYRGYGLPMNE
jgi:DNA-directed RNA polymerase sigma subunit (sigma70/sigma32)